MAQLIQSIPSVSSCGANEMMANLPPASSRQFPVRTGALAMKRLEAELNEHRYYLERKVEQRTEQLAKRLKLLESCNATLCEKLAQAKKDIAALQKLADSNLSGTEENDCSGQSTGIGDDLLQQAEPDVAMSGPGM